MADQHPVEGSSTSRADGESFESMVELNIKTLDSQIHSLQMDKNTPVLLLKEKIASEIGLPVGQQRLIFRGKVLKDNHLLSEYHVENGHTLHLVARQSSESQPPSTSSGETSANNGNRGHNANAAGPRNRIGQITQSVVIGPLNVGDQSQGIVPDLTRIVGAVLNSIGMGSQTATNVIGGVQPTVQFNTAVQAGQGNVTEGIRSNTGSQGQVGSQAQPVQVSPSQSFAQPIPDSLHTLSEFMNRMELALSQNGYQPNLSSANTGDLPTVELPSSASGLSTPEALSFVLHHAQRLLSNQTVAALSHIAGRLEQEGGSTDPTVRGEISAEAMQVGLAMQHLGALLLELGRTILTLRMGQSPAESCVNAGPAVYLSPSGPNPIMVQPFPLQTNSLFGGSTAGPSNPGTFGPIGMGTVPRLVNIHIHSAVGPRASNAEALQGERGNQTVSSSSSQSRLPTDSSSPSTVIADVNSRTRNSVDNMCNENQAPSGQADSSTVQNPSVRPGAGNSEVKNQLRNLADNGAGGVVLSVPGSVPEREGQKAHPQYNQHSNENGESVVRSKDIPSSSSFGGSIDYSNGDSALKTGDDSECAPASGQGIDNRNAAASVPLGLGLGCLQPQRLTRQQRSLGKCSGSVTSSTPNQTQQTRADGQQDSQSLASFANSRNTNIPSSTQMPHPLGHIMESVQMGGEGADGRFDIASAMSQALHSPALNGLLAGASEQTGVGSPDVLRNMLEQLTGSPSMRNTLNQMTQQFDSQDLGNMSSGFGGGQGAGINLASMVQQMMPIVAQALTGGSAIPQPIAMGPDPERQYNERSSSRYDKTNDQNSQIDLRQVVERIEHQDQPGDIFHSIVESAGCLYDSSSCAEDLVDELSHQEDLANEFMEILRQDLRQRLKGE